MDDEQVGFMATKHLIEIGRRRIAHIGTPRVSPALGVLKDIAEPFVNTASGFRPGMCSFGLTAMTPATRPDMT